MIFKILKEYIRRISRNYKIYAISILGMSIAIIASFHIYHFVYKEFSVDGFHTKKKDVYRVLNIRSTSNNKSVLTVPALGSYLKEKLPEINDFSQLMPAVTDILIDGKKKRENIIKTDASFFKLFDFKVISGNINDFQKNPEGIVISNKKAKILFGKENPIGKKMITVAYGSTKKTFHEVVAVIQDFPETSTLQPNFIFNINLDNVMQSESMKWSFGITHLYIYAPDITDNKGLNNKITSVIDEHRNTSSKQNKSSWYEAQRLDNIYFNSEDIINQQIKGSLKFTYTLIAIAILTLLLAVFNFIIMNLGLNLSRIDEFCTKRFLGVSKKHIFLQLCLEPVCNTIICFVITLLTFSLFMPIVKNLSGFNYQLNFESDLLLLFIYFLVIIVIGILIGLLQFIFSYQSIFNTSKKNLNTSPQKVMIIFQIVLVISVLTSVLFLKKQMNYIETKDYGFDKDNVAMVNSFGFDEVVINELKSKNFVKNIALGEMLYRHTIDLQTITISKTKDTIKAMVIGADANYLATYGIKLISGKNLNPDNRLEFKRGFSIGASFNKNEQIVEVLVNEKFIKKSGFKKPLGAIIEGENFNKAVIVGVFKDVYNTPFYNPIQPLILGHGFNNFMQTNVFVSYDKSKTNELKSFLKELYLKKGMSNVEHYLFHTNLDDIYKKEFQLKRLLEAFTVIVLFISLLGMIAISLFITESKTKEIGIRKVNGATINEIMFMLNKGFIKWVVIAFVMACPIVYYAMSKWLENFAYKTTLSWWVFALAGVFTLIIALLTVSWQTYRAATRNPVESLRDE